MPMRPGGGLADRLRAGGLSSRVRVNLSAVLPLAVARWSASVYDEGNNRLTDLSGNGLHLTLVGSPTRSQVNGQWQIALNGSSQYLEAADDALLDFGATDSFTAAVSCLHPTWSGTTRQVFMAKKSSVMAAGAGWALVKSSTANRLTFQFSDGTNQNSPTADVTGIDGTVAVHLGRRSVPHDTARAFAQGVAGSPLTDSTAGSFANAEVLRIGRLSGAGTDYAAMSFVAAAVFRRSLSDTEVGRVTAELLRA